MLTSRFLQALLISGLSLAITACGGGGGGGSKSTSSVVTSIGGGEVSSVASLGAESSLQQSSAPNQISSISSLSSIPGVSSASSFVVDLASSSVGSFSSFPGSVSSMSSSSSSVAYTLGGSVNGLTGAGLVLTINGRELEVSGETFSFGEVPYGTAYSANIKTQPEKQTCIISSPTGTVSRSDHLRVNCYSNPMLGGTVIGLTGGGLVLTNNDGSDLEVNGETFSFGEVPYRSAYSVKIKTQPEGQSCRLSSASGTAIINVSSVRVECKAAYPIGGSVSGLTASGLVLVKLNEELAIDKDGTFTFKNEVGDGDFYSVTIKSHPEEQVCAITKASGRPTAAVTDIAVTCTSGYLIEGSVSGLTGIGLELVYGTETLKVSENTFVFNQKVAHGKNYWVSIKTQPQGQTCSIANERGVATDKIHIQVYCLNSFSLGGSVSGLVAEGLVLVNNGKTLAVNGNSFAFREPVIEGGNYDVIVQAHPAGLVCSIAHGSGVAVGDVTDVVVTCTSSVLAPFAGNVYGPGNVDGEAANAFFDSPHDLVIDSKGNLYVADYDNHAIRKITPAGKVTTFAGGKSDAPFYRPSGIVVDSQDNLYVVNHSSSSDSKIHKITPDGEVTLFSTAGKSFVKPNALAIDVNDNLYVTMDHAVLKITSTGEKTTLAGSGSRGFADGVGAAAKFADLVGIAVDTEGNVYVADSYNYAIRKISPSGEVVTFAGGSSGSRADGIGTDAKFSSFLGKMIIADGNLYVSEGSVVRKITPSAEVTTLKVFDSNASIKGIALGVDGNFYLSESYTDSIYKVVSGSAVRLAGSGIRSTSGSDDGVGGKATFTSPQGVVSDLAGNLYVLETGASSSIRKITPAGMVTTFVELPDYAQSIAIDVAGNLYVGESQKRSILKITPSGEITTLAGGESGFVDGIGGQAKFRTPSGIVMGLDGNLYVADTSNYAIRKIAPSGEVTTLAGGQEGSSDGVGSAARFGSLYGITIDSAGNLYVADLGNKAIRKITLSGEVTTIASDLGNPKDLTMDKSGYLYVADTANNLIRRISPAGEVTILAGQPGQKGFVPGELPGVISEPKGITIYDNILYFTQGYGVVRITPLP